MVLHVYKNVPTSRYLVGVIGNKSCWDSFVQSKVLQWSQYVELLSPIAVDQPQASYIALVKSPQSEWLFLQRVTPDCGNLSKSALSTNFIPSLIGLECSFHEDYFTHSPSAWMASISLPHNHCFPRLLQLEVCCLPRNQLHQVVHTFQFCRPRPQLPTSKTRGDHI